MRGINFRRCFRCQPIARKLTVMVLGTSTMTLIVACSVFAIYDNLNSRSRLVRDVTMLADIVGTNSTAALTFADPVAAQATLGAVSVNPHVVQARLFTIDGRQLASYSRSGDSPAPEADTADEPDTEPRFERGRLHVTRPIVLEGDTVGTIVLESDTSELLDAARPVRRDRGGHAVRRLLDCLRTGADGGARDLHPHRPADRGHTAGQRQPPVRRARGRRRRRRDRRAGRSVQRDAVRDRAPRRAAAAAARGARGNRVRPDGGVAAGQPGSRRAPGTGRWKPTGPRASSSPT